MSDRLTVDTITSDQLDALILQAARMEHAVQQYAELRVQLEDAEAASRKFLEQRQEMAAERHAWQERGEKAERAANLLADSHRRAEQADAVTAQTKRLMERRTKTLRERAERAEHERDVIAADLETANRLRDKAPAAIARVGALHRRNEHTGDCEYCSERDYPDYPDYAVSHPCPTITALDEPSRPTTTDGRPLFDALTDMFARPFPWPPGPVDWQATIREWEHTLKTDAERRQEAEQERDGAYRERAHLAAYLAALHPSHIGRSDPNAPDWPVLIVETPAGQMSWHIAERDVDLFAHVRHTDRVCRGWDGHTTDQKYERLRKLTATAKPFRISAFDKDGKAVCTCTYGERCPNCHD
jgi:hypothetical protein